MSYQHHVIEGNLGRDPDMRYTPDGKAVTSFSVAVNDSYHNVPVWFNVSVWGPQAEACNQYLSKGSRVLVDGDLGFDPDTGGPKIWFRNDGSAASSFELNGRRVVFLDPPPRDQQPNQQRKPAQARGNPQPHRQAPPDPEDDEIPF